MSVITGSFLVTELSKNKIFMFHQGYNDLDCTWMIGYIYSQPSSTHGKPDGITYHEFL
jgi:hypothetical protein